MSELITHTVSDLRSGRTSWRVMMLLFVPALALGVTLGLV